MAAGYDLWDEYRGVGSQETYPTATQTVCDAANCLKQSLKTHSAGSGRVIDLTMPQIDMRQI